MKSFRADLRGRTCLVTGASSGIGKAAALGLARLGADLVLLCRNRGRAEATAAEIGADSAGARVDIVLADLASQAEVRRAAREFLALDRPLHVLLNNAGVVMNHRALTADGIETTFAVNHLGYFLLTELLLERLRASAPARIVNVASDAHRFVLGRLDFDNLNGDKKYSTMGIYGQSKLANILFTRELARRLEGSGVTVNCLHPGTVATRFGQNNSGLFNIGTRLIAPFVRTPQKGAETAVYLCAAPEVEGISGRYFYNCRDKRPSAAARNDDDARRLWEVSAALCGIDG